MYYFKKRIDKNSIVPKDNDVTLIIKKLRNYLSIKKPFFFFFLVKNHFKPCTFIQTNPSIDH